MEYIFITIAAITITTVLFYMLMNRVFRIRISIKPLILCALCSLFLTLILPRIIISFTGLAGTVSVLTIFSVVFAYFVAFYEHKKIKVSALATNSIEEFSFPIVLQTEEENQATKTGLNPLHYPEVSKTNLHDIPGMSNSINLQNLAIEDDPYSENILDYAYQQKEVKNYDEALRAFKEILQIDPSSSDAPFVVIEIGSLLKLRGAYDEAIQVFLDAKSLPGLQDDPDLRQEFINTIAYLRIIKNVLIYRGVGLLPFNKISEDVTQEIEKEYCEWRGLS